ncbi:MAG: PLP-dependent transferase [Pirellulaceae bacterium]
MGNPRLTIPDLPAAWLLPHELDLLVAVDNTFATHNDASVGVGGRYRHALRQKYLAGHSDCLAGVLAVKSPELLDRLYFLQNATGAVLSPFEAFLAWAWTEDPRSTHTRAESRL